MKRQFRQGFKTLIRYPLEAVLVYTIYYIFKLLPVEKSSALSGWLSRKVGPLTSAQAIGYRNLEMAYPNNTREQNTEILKNVWDNFGRLVGELPHLANIDVHNDPRFEIIGVEHIDNLRDNGKPAIYFSAHLANWEAACVAGAQRGLKVTKIYRALNNPYLKKLWHKLMLGADKELLNKGPESGRRIIQLLSKGEHISMLLDQKLNRGLPIPFFGRESMTPPAGARMAMRFNCPMIPSRVERLGGFKFRITYYPPLEISNTGDLTYDLYETLCRMNNMIESWVRARPDQWLWIYRRWPKDGDIIKPIDLKKK